MLTLSENCEQFMNIHLIILISLLFFHNFHQKYLLSMKNMKKSKGNVNNSTYFPNLLILEKFHDNSRKRFHRGGLILKIRWGWIYWGKFLIDMQGSFSC
jgi:hypothetical protein